MTGVVALDHLLLAMPRGKEAEARAFYGDLLGLPELKKPPNLEVRGGVWFKLGTQQLHLGVEKDFRPAQKAHPAFLVRDLGGLRARLGSMATRPTKTSRWPAMQRFYVADPFGNRLELLEPVVR